MTQEEKDLLIKDLCARLPYEVKIQYENDIFTIDHISATYEEIKLDTPNNYTIDVLEVKPYLFPISSMTDEQESYIHFNTKFRTDRFGDLTTKIDEDDNYFYTDIFDYVSLIDWLLKNHFDIYGLIPKGLAIDATNLNIY